MRKRGLVTMFLVFGILVGSLLTLTAFTPTQPAGQLAPTVQSTDNMMPMSGTMPMSDMSQMMGMMMQMMGNMQNMMGTQPGMMAGAMAGRMPMTGTMPMSGTMPMGDMSQMMGMMMQMMGNMQNMMGTQPGMMAGRMPMTGTMPMSGTMPMGDMSQMMPMMMQMMGTHMQMMMGAQPGMMAGSTPMTGTMPMSGTMPMGGMSQMMPMMMQMMGNMHKMMGAQPGTMDGRMPMTGTMPMSGTMPMGDMSQMMGMMMQMMGRMMPMSGGMMEMMPSANLAPLGKGFYEGDEVQFIHTETSDPGVAKLLTEMMGPEVVLVPELAETPSSLLANVYVFTNGVEGSGPFGFQPDVFDAVPGDAGYRPLRAIQLVSWQDENEPRLLNSVAEIEAATDDGEIEIEQSGAVVNMPILVWPGGQR